MKLDEFIKETLVQVVKGVSSASGEVKELGGEINPSDDICVGGATISNTKPQTIKFDIALQVKETSEKNGGAKAKMAVVSFGGGIKSHDESHTEHRIQFQIPVNLP